MTDTDPTAVQIYRIFIKATPEQIWTAITTPEFTRRYFHGAAISVTADGYESRGPDGASWGDAAVEEFNPPKRLVHGWRSLYDPSLAQEPESRVSWDIEDTGDGVCLLTVTHDRLEASPGTAASVFGVGWIGVISSLKTLLETDEPLRPLT